MTTSTATPLAEAVREHTRDLHESSESTTIMDDIVSERVTVDMHVELIAQLLHVYRALEQGADELRTAGSDIDALLDETLYRVASIEEDLAHIVGEDWESVTDPHPATRAYAAKIRDAAATRNTPRFLAHHYTRYLGDLSGGLIIGRNIQRHTGLGADGAPGVRFYEFPEIPKPRPYKDGYREALNALDWDDAMREEFLESARESYLLGQAMFSDIVASRSEGAIA